MADFPRVQPIPVQSEGVSFGVDGTWIARYNAG
jgi:hypothetical protein